MKNYFKVVLLSSFYFGNSYATSFTKDDGNKKDTAKKQLNLIAKTDVLLPVIGAISQAQNRDGGGYGYYCSFTLEKLLKKRHSVQLTNTYDWSNNTTQYLQHLENNKWSLIPEYKFYVSKKKCCSGYYIGAYGKYSHYNYENTQVTNANVYADIIKYKETMIGGGISNGVQFYLFKRLTVDVLVGVGILKPINYSDTQFFDGTANTTYYKDYKMKLDARAAVNIGYKF